MGGAMVGGVVALFVLIFIGGFALLSPKPAVNEKLACNSDSDCVPAGCCHSSSVVNKSFAPVCLALVCSADCESVLDCGQASPKCVSNKCEVVKNEQKSRSAY